MRLTDEARHDEQYFVVRVCKGRLGADCARLACVQPHMRAKSATQRVARDLDRTKFSAGKVAAPVSLRQISRVKITVSHQHDRPLRVFQIVPLQHRDTCKSGGAQTSSYICSPRRQGSEVRWTQGETISWRSFIHHVLSTTSRCCRIPYTTRRTPVSTRTPTAVEIYGVQARLLLCIAGTGNLRTDGCALVPHSYNPCSRNVSSTCA